MTEQKLCEFYLAGNADECPYHQVPTVPNPTDQATPVADDPRSVKLPPSSGEWVLRREAAINRLASRLPDLLFRWSPHPSQSDYECAFCGRRPESYHVDIQHDIDCLGVELLRSL